MYQEPVFFLLGEVVTTDLTFAQVFTYVCTFATLFLPWRMLAGRCTC